MGTKSFFDPKSKGGMLCIIQLQNLFHVLMN